MLEKYGPPNEATPTRLFWHRNRPWKRTELTSDAVVHHWPAPHTDFLTQYIDYRVPPELTHLITMFDGSILVDRTRGEVAARCDSEAANVLGLNMIHELVTGKRTVEEARHTSEQSMVAYNLGRDAPMPSGCCSRSPRAALKTWTRATSPGRCSSRRRASSRTRSPLGVARRPPTDARLADPAATRIVQGRWMGRLAVGPSSGLPGSDCPIGGSTSSRPVTSPRVRRRQPRPVGAVG